MIAAILWVFLGSILGAFAVALVAARKQNEVDKLRASNARLVASIATASIHIKDLRADLAKAKTERDNWHRLYTEQDDSWMACAPGDRG